MPTKVKFVLNQRALQDVILYSEETDVEGALRDALGGGPDVVVEKSNNKRKGGRIRARVYGSTALEAATGSLSRRLG